MKPDGKEAKIRPRVPWGHRKGGNAMFYLFILLFPLAVLAELLRLTK